MGTQQHATMLRVLAVISILVAVATAQGRWIVRNRAGDPVLEVLFQNNVTMVYKDEFTGAWEYLGVWEGDPVPGYLMLGHRAEGNWDGVNGPIPMIRDLVGDIEGRYTTNPTDFEEIWRDQGGLGLLDVAFWRPVCPAGYVPVGDIAYACEWCGWPKPLAYLGRMRCLSGEVAEQCNVKQQPIWTNFGGWENDRGSVWGINPNAGVSAFWMANAGWDTPPQNGVAYCLREVEFQASGEY